MALNDLPPTPQLSEDIFRLTVPLLSIPDVSTLQFLMAVERQAMNVINLKVAEMQRPGTQLLDPTGRPIIDVAQKLHEELTAYMVELLSHQTIAEEWAQAPSLIAKQGRVTTTSFQIAILTYQELVRILAMMTPEFANVVDAVAVVGLNALHHGVHPVEAFKRNLKVEAKTNQGKIDVLAQDSAVAQRYRVLEDALLWFLRAKKFVTETSPDVLPSLTMEGVALLKHLLAVLGSTQSIQQRGPALAQQAMEDLKQGEAKPEDALLAELAEVNRQLADPNAELPEA